MKNQRKSKSLQRIDPSKQVEVAYRREMDELTKYMLDIVLDEIRDTKMADDTADYLRWLSRKSTVIKDKLDNLNIDSISKAIAGRFVRGIETLNRRRFASKTAKSFGVDVDRLLKSSGQAVRDQVEIGIEYNASLIKSVAEEFKQELGNTIMFNIQNGERSTNLITQFKEKYQVSENKAKFLARDQTSKINAKLVQARSESLGSKTYEWSGSMDERERPSHKAMQGMLCKWDDPTVYSDDSGKTWKKRKNIGGVELHPSGDYQCRCAALAVVEW